MKSNLDKLFKTNKDLEKSGVWFDLKEEVGFLVKPFLQSNPHIKAAFAIHYKPFARQIELDTLEAEKQREIMVKIFVQSCLVDWKGIEIEGKIEKFDKDLAIKFLTGLPELFETLMKYAQDFSNYKDELGEETVGNS